MPHPETCDYAVRDIPKLTVSKQLQEPPTKHDPSKEYQFRYRAKRHGTLPHVVKFSGGRSSGMLLFTLLENKILDADRGDVILFNNTSAEHPDTYRFVQDCSKASDRYGIPSFWVEFQTYEDARNGEWTRLPSYRLVINHPVPLDINTLKALKRSPLGLDLYLWAVYRTFSLKRPMRLSWPQLYRQFGVDPAKASDKFTVRDFRTDCLRELKKIKLAWPDLQLCDRQGRLDPLALEARDCTHDRPTASRGVAPGSPRSDRARAGCFRWR